MKSTYDQIWEAAIKKLEIRLHGKEELTRKLKEKFPDDREVILKVIAEMERVNLLNDRLFTENFVQHLIQKPIGYFKIMMETRKRGLNPDAVEQALLDAEWSEEAAAKKAFEQKSRILNKTDERKQKQKLANFLKNRGFKDAIIFKIFDLESGIDQ